MKKIILISSLTFLTLLPVFSNELDIKTDKKISSGSAFTFNINVNEKNTIELTNKAGISNNSSFMLIENYAKKKKVPEYKRKRRIGIGLLVPGVILFSSGFIMMGAGIPLILIKETVRERTYNYAYQVNPNNYYSNTYYDVYPYQSIGIPLAATGALFFCVGLGLMIPGIVNLAMAAKLKKSNKKRSMLNNVKIIADYNFYNNEVLLGAGFSL